MQEGNQEEFFSLMSVLSTPYDEQTDSLKRFGAKRPQWADSKAGCSMLSCSS
jgi:uncharacterized protein YdiU (UPF0061 family)